MSRHKVTFLRSGRGAAQERANPQFPYGVHVDVAPGAIVSCKVELPYPAPECGVFCIQCQTCGFRGLVTASGRTDDPLSVRVPCILRPGGSA